MPISFASPLSKPLLAALFCAGAVLVPALAGAHAAEDAPAAADRAYKIVYPGGDPDRLQIVSGGLHVLIPAVTTFWDREGDALILEGPPQDLEKAEKIVNATTRPRPVYRLTFTFTQPGAAPRRLALTLAAGTRGEAKQGSKFPLAAGQSADGQRTEIQYQDLGLELEAWLDLPNSDGSVGLRAKVAESAVAEQHSPIGVQSPIFQQFVLDSHVTVVPGKPLALGTVEGTGTGGERVEVVAEPVR
jgi:hypothetical protein